MLSDRRIGRALGALVLLIALLGAHDAAAGNTQGSACTTAGAVAPIYNSANDDGNNLVCISGTWQYPAYVVQSYSGAAGASCSGYPAGALHYTTTIGNVEFCDGANWRFLAAGSTSCGSPSGLSFTNLTGQSLSTSVTSNTATITFSGCSSALSVSVSGTATAQISVNGGAWATSGAILSGQTLQVRMTTSGSVSTVLTATVTVGGSSTNWTTTTRGGSLQVFTTLATYIGDSLGGLSGADAVCQAAAGTAGYAGTYKAIMSDDTTSAASRLTLSYPIVNAYDGTTVASSNLWIGSLTTAIKDPSGGSGGGGAGGVWTGTNADGSKGTGQTCSSWTANTSADQGFDGRTDNLWVYGANPACNSAYSLYCIQQ
jgi:hypothetical protein